MRDTLGGDFPLFFFMAVNKPTYGGQALIEGVMIRGVNVVTMAVRHPTGDIVQLGYPVNRRVIVTHGDIVYRRIEQWELDKNEYLKYPDSDNGKVYKYLLDLFE